ncbi:hypothetical protein AVI51_12380 [Piscirickettsia salmonis]|uniref:Uncharacterized protein n=1 Tax=Piscirickettsia salmonis TaxID=1238 RepID=A0A9Q5YKL0_PISSA|nr:hypothetical protein [Piscirickettsia salmonis]ALA26190.1 hypothetical protein KW89_2728 [Piscirickettsia salmonis]APS43631.1 hypothetical protein AVI48_04095 [Piscirickettsia salmonis]APS46986.1 hypothetical protein AVI49_04705 [Piscirickettsia salmonis]APS51565.1 hypothetical protein AVI50_12490 [Piscirickettsia salmonis]APS54779.1 hypothetical protein AVI51_12380 [Piscirickettsia salmonis]
MERSHTFNIAKLFIREIKNFINYHQKTYPVSISSIEFTNDQRKIINLHVRYNRGIKKIQLKELITDDELLQQISPLECFLVSYINNNSTLNENINFSITRNHQPTDELIELDYISFHSAENPEIIFKVKNTETRKGIALSEINQHFDLIQLIPYKTALQLGAMYSSINSNLISNKKNNGHNEH